MKHVNLIFICVLLSIISYQAIKIKTKQTKDPMESLYAKCERKTTVWIDCKKHVLHLGPCETLDSNCNIVLNCGTMVSANGSAQSKASGYIKPRKIYR